MLCIANNRGDNAMTPSTERAFEKIPIFLNVFVGRWLPACARSKKIVLMASCIHRIIACEPVKMHRIAETNAIETVDTLQHIWRGWEKAAPLSRNRARFLTSRQKLSDSDLTVCERVDVSTRPTDGCEHFHNSNAALEYTSQRLSLLVAAFRGSV